ncbi:MAG: alpha/beta hydrolase [Devosia sp.]|nr:alpha/beta hydrolase [Devosia sp.]
MRLEQLERKAFDCGGLRLNWFDAGGPGLPVVFQHGLCGDARQTAEAFPDDPRFRLITLECRGHGQSEAGPREALSITTFADDVAALVGHLCLAPAVVGGISMGAAIAERLAVRRPELVRALILARPAWVTAAAPDNMLPNAEVGHLLASYSPAVASAAFSQTDTARRLAAEAPDNLASLMRFFERAPHDLTSSLLTAVATDGPGIVASDLAAVLVPTLVLGHERDAVHPLSHARTLASLIPNAELAIITPKATDKVAYVDDFHRALQSFLEVL